MFRRENNSNVQTSNIAALSHSCPPLEGEPHSSRTAAARVCRRTDQRQQGGVEVLHRVAGVHGEHAAAQLQPLVDGAPQTRQQNLALPQAVEEDGKSPQEPRKDQLQTHSTTRMKVLQVPAHTGTPKPKTNLQKMGMFLAQSLSGGPPAPQTRRTCCSVCGKTPAPRSCPSAAPPSAPAGGAPAPSSTLHTRQEASGNKNPFSVRAKPPDCWRSGRRGNRRNPRLGLFRMQLSFHLTSKAFLQRKVSVCVFLCVHACLYVFLRICGCVCTCVCVWMCLCPNFTFSSSEPFHVSSICRQPRGEKLNESSSHLFLLKQ